MNNKQKYTFVLKNNSRIVITDDYEDSSLIKTKMAELLTSKNITAFETPSDLVVFYPNQISAIHITKLENKNESTIKSTNKYVEPETNDEIQYDDSDDVDYSDDDDSTNDFINKIDNSSALFEELGSEYDEDMEEDDVDESDEDLESEQILDEDDEEIQEEKE